MDFISAVFRDLMIYTIPWMIARAIIYPLKSVNIHLSAEIQKKEGKQSDEKAQLPKSIPLSRKIQYIQNVFKTGNFGVFYDKWQYYLIPFTTSRFFEGIVFFVIMRFFTDIVGIGDVFFLVSAFACFPCQIVGAFVFKVNADIMEKQPGLNLKYQVIPTSKKFWKDYELYMVYYQTYGYFQTYFHVINTWFFQAGFLLECIFYALSRVLGVASSQPVAFMSRYAEDYKYDYVKTYNYLLQKFGPKGFFAGCSDGCLIEFIFAFIHMVCIRLYVNVF